MNFDLIKIFGEMGAFALAIVSLLSAMAVASLAVYLERLWAFNRGKKQSRRFAAAADELIEREDYPALLEQAEKHRHSPLASLFAAGLRTYLKESVNRRGALGAADLARRQLNRKYDALEAETRRGFGVLASVGSIAPFVGLLGTVVGIIDAFEGIAREGSGGLGAVSAGIAEALVVTAIGLCVAIPAVLAYNSLSSAADSILLRLQHSGSELADFLEHRHLPSHMPARGLADSYEDSDPDDGEALIAGELDLLSGEINANA
ncbi:MAG: MotA/TolQ/ExbB proton channel family protein [Myxococcales bacterium]|nr:MAG: MotA/TolQ/ExbB proton channel family protein [Myxococcales bacterium]